ncbi:MAG TPA: hypothetical protein VKM72_27625 [Thermoanaerobaculia bacterium]|nr:hypothetical protein [Thermoanaerobaculia bacterium]
MFIGHFALGFAGKRAAPAVSLGSLFLACQPARSGSAWDSGIPFRRL